MKIKIFLSVWFLITFGLWFFCNWQTSGTIQTNDVLPDDYQTSRLEDYQTTRPELETVVETLQPWRNIPSDISINKSLVDSINLNIADLKEIFQDNQPIWYFQQLVDTKVLSNSLGVWFGWEFTDEIENYKKLLRIEKNIDGPAFHKIANLVTSIKQPNYFFKNMWNFWLNSLLAILYLIIFFYCTHLFNESRWIVSPDWSVNKKIHWLLNFFSGKFNVSEMSKKKKVIRGLSIFSSLILLWIILSFIEPNYNIFSVDSIYFALFIIVCVILGAMAKDIVYYLIIKLQNKEKIYAKIIPAWYFISIVSVVINRLAGFLPSAVFGSVLSVNYKNIDSEQIENWKNYSKSVWVTIIISLIFRFVSMFFEWQIYILIIGIAYGMLNDIFWSLTLSDIFWWKKIFKFNKYLRFWTYFLVIFLFFYLMINPNWDFEQVKNSFDNNFFKMIVILLWIMWTTIIFSIYAKYIHPKIYKKI